MKCMRLLPALLIALFLLVPFAVSGAETVEGRSQDRLTIRFDDGAQVRLRGGRLVSLGGGDIREVDELLGRFGTEAVRRLFYSPEHDIDSRRIELVGRAGRALPDLNSWFEIEVPASDSESLLQALQAVEQVVTAYRSPLPVRSPVDIEPPTPDGDPDQVYLDPAPEGIDARAAWTHAGGRGQGILLVDIEYDWRDTHEDLESVLGTQMCFTPDSPGEIEHGTAVIGMIAGGDNAYGVTGIANQVEVGLVTHYPNGMNYSVARAIECAAGLMSAGDVLLIEAQTVGPNSLFVPVEWDAAEYDAITLATAAGIIVVEAAGNGGEDLDDPVFGGAFDRGVRDSGALIVGAGADLWYTEQSDLSRLDFSTYGSRVDLQGWGDDVVTTGFGDAFDGGGDPNQYYTALFNGTSSAAPMIAGATAILEGVQAACGGSPLTPVEVREILVNTGTPQVAGPYPGNIGPRPDLASALALVDTDNDADGFAECAGDCDDGSPGTYPGAVEVNDGLDNQCPGGAGYGSVDEISGNSGFHNPADKAEYSWTAQGGATLYQVERADSPEFASGCVRWETAGSSIRDDAVPVSGQTWYYLSRPVSPNPGSWGSGTTGTERNGPCLQ
jgi:serine protease